MDVLKTLLALPKNAVYSLINNQDKEIFITYTTDTISSLTRLIKEARAGYGLHINLYKFHYKLLEISDKDSLKLRFNYWYDYYQSQGYKLINKRRPVKFKLINFIGEDFRNRHKVLIYARLKNQTNYITLGVFDKIKDCDSFINSYGGIYSIKYASNDLTKEFLSKGNK